MTALTCIHTRMKLTNNKTDFNFFIIINIGNNGVNIQCVAIQYNVWDRNDRKVSTLEWNWESNGKRHSFSFDVIKLEKPNRTVLNNNEGYNTWHS